ncbi:MAG: ROK family protein [Fibrobacterota bacterium]
MPAQPAKKTRNAPQNSIWIGFDLGGTKMMAAVYDSKLNLIAKKRKKTKAFEGVKVGLERVIATIKAALEEAGIDYQRLTGIGMAIPGLLDLDRGVILDAPNLGWKNVRIRQRLHKVFNCAVTIINDVDAGVYGEYRLGAARKARCVVGIFPGTGIGGGCIYEGDIIRGKRNSCLEIGHIQLQPEGPLCGCGQRGCLEAIASRLAIAASAAKAVYRGEAPHLMEISGTDIRNIRSGALAASIEAGDSAIEQIVREAAQWLGIGVSVAINMLAPDVVLLGGGLVESMPDIFREVVEETARKRVMPSFSDSFEVVVAQLGDYATCTGAAAWAINSLEPSRVRQNRKNKDQAIS